MPASSSSSPVPLIKGYLPVRLRLPRQPQLVRRGDGTEDDNDGDTEDTFFFVREHQGRAATEGTGEDTTTTTTKRGITLFVANAPVVPGVSTKLLLQSIFSRYADVTRVTAVRNPRAASHESLTTTTTSTVSSLLAWSDKESMFRPTFLPHILSETEGKYAHVVFDSPKELKKAVRALESLVSASSTRRKNRKSNHHGQEKQQQQQRALILDKLELQTLSDESLRQREATLRKELEEDDDDGFGADFDTTGDTKASGGGAGSKHACVLAVAKRYRESCRFLKNRSLLLEECNAVMQAYEDAEEAKRSAREAARAEPDDDGFVTVSYSNAVGSKIEFEQSATATTPSRRKGNKRSRRKKEAVGSGELKDFYRFQRADNRKRTMDDLRKKFEEDVRKVKRLKEEKEYRPF